MNNDNEKYNITVEEGARRLNLSTRTIYKRLRSGKLDGKKIATKHGLSWRISEDEFKNQATIINEVVEVDRSINVNELKQAFYDVVQGQQQAINELKQDNKQLKEDNNKIISYLRRISRENREIKRIIDNN